jgi:hypothetical protein
MPSRASTQAGAAVAGWRQMRAGRSPRAAGLRRGSDAGGGREDVEFPQDTARASIPGPCTRGWSGGRREHRASRISRRGVTRQPGRSVVIIRHKSERVISLAVMRTGDEGRSNARLADDLGPDACRVSPFPQWCPASRVRADFLPCHTRLGKIIFDRTVRAGAAGAARRRRHPATAQSSYRAATSGLRGWL